jgi:signal transduction histidine kinase
VTDDTTSSSSFGRLATPAVGSRFGDVGAHFDGVLVTIRLVGMAVLGWGMFASSKPAGTDRRTALAILVGLATLGYLGSLVTRRFRSGAMAWCLFLVAVTGGAAAAFGSLGIVYAVIVGLASGAELSPRLSCALVASALASLAVVVLAAGTSWETLGWLALAGGGGLMGGMNRRQLQLRAEQSEQLLLERERTAVEAAHAAALGERNRIAREVHDVLAHSLGALAVQLEVVDALLEEGDVERAKAAVVTSRRLSLEGLDETRRAVHALRDAPLDLGEQLAALAASNAATFRIVGTERVLSADAGLALYRAAQEALTNARKHAPGATASVVLEFGPDRTFLMVVDEYPPGAGPEAPSRPGTSSGAGYGLTGMRERVALLGGSASAGPTGDGSGGWRVEVEIPVQANGAGPS